MLDNKKTVQNGGWRPVRKLRTHEHVLAAVEEQILSGRLKRGDKLPGERELSELLGVSRPSVREALRALESLGIVTAAAGSGKNAGSMIASEPSIALSYFLRAHVGLANYKFGDVIETRVALERAAAHGAAEHATAESLASLRQLEREMSDCPNPTEFHDLDSEFHVGIARASGNEMLSDFMEAVRSAVRDQMVAATVDVKRWDLVARKLCKQHDEILDAIEKRDENGAAELVSSHILGFYERSGLYRHRPPRLPGPRVQ